MNWLRGGDADDDVFDEEGAYVPEHLPEPGAFLDGHEVLTGDDHLAVHAASRERFEEFGVYDATFGYNLAQLNRDTRHPDAGLRYAVDDVAPDVLRVEFTPTTAFCPQSGTLVTGIFRAWNASESEYRLVSVRVAPMHQHSEATNEKLAGLEERYLETGEVAVDEESPTASGADESETGTREDGGSGASSAPF
ncbi:hypothetical protein GCM10027435_21370 [Haloparvum alkalitolerans]|uniref:hypothetical protein n=1 Tax=Haloparvum alkalitolerans TaxID=1042953 RepID=UPI003CF0B1F5